MRALGFLALAALLAAVAAPAIGQVNRPSTADAGFDATYDESPAPFSTDTATLIVLDGSGSYDPDDPTASSLKVRWSFVSSTVGAPAPKPNLQFAPVDEMKAQFYAPMLGADDPPQVQYTFQAFADDKSPQDPAGSCIKPETTERYPAQMCDTVTVTIRNVNQRPDFITSEVLISPETVDIVADAGKTIEFRLGDPGAACITAGGLKDDGAALAVHVVLTNPEAGTQIVVPMTKVDSCDLSSSDSTEVSQWRGTLPVDTPGLISNPDGAQSWVVNVEGHDHEGGFFVAGTDGEDAGATEQFFVVTSLVTDLETQVTFSQLTATKPRPAGCFAGTQSVAPQALGTGQILRPEVFYDSETGLLAGTNALLMQWKVTYQSCILSGSFPAKGPEVELRSPYHLNLDTIFSGDQEVAIRFYDRLGQVEEFVVPLTKDVGRPLFFVDVQPVTYEGVPFPFMVYVQDKIDTALRLEIDGFGFSDYEKRITSVDPTYEPHALMFFMPRLSQAVMYELSGDQFCEVLFDTDGNGLLETGFDAVGLKRYALIADKRGGSAAVTNYIVDANRDGRGNPGETLLPGHKDTKIDRTDAPLCIVPFTLAEQAFLDQATTQVYQFNLTRVRLGQATYRINVNDLVFNQVAQNYVFKHAGGEVPQRLTGTFITRKAETDARVVDARIANGPFLPGDRIELNLTVRHDAPLIPNLRVPLTVVIDEPGQDRFGKTTEFTAATPQGNDTIVPIKAAPRDPGLHKLRFAVSAPSNLNETVPANNVRENVTVEVFLGAVSDGPWTTGKKFYIRADPRGLPVLDGGAVEVDASGKVVPGKNYDLTYRDDASGPYYVFQAPNKEGKTVTLFWDPLKRYSLAYNKPCEELTAEQKAVNLTADPPREPRCRPITVLPKAEVEGAEESPAVGVALLAILVAVAAIARRRRGT